MILVTSILRKVEGCTLELKVDVVEGVEVAGGGLEERAEDDWDPFNLGVRWREGILWP